jgi:sugar phosphate isomerase/epimerase
VTTRRDFLTTAAAATAAAAAVGLMPGALRAAQVPFSTAPDFNVTKLDLVGLQLYTARSEMAKNVEATLEKVAAVGYREVEFAGYFNRDPVALRAKLDSLTLTAPACHVGLPQVEAQWTTTAAAAKTLGHEWVVVASVQGKSLASLDGLKDLAKRFNDAGSRCRDAGMRFGYHNHNAEFRPATAPSGTVTPLDILLSETDPTLVDFEMDLYWITNAGQDPLAYFKKYPGRFKLAHVKDSGGAPKHEMRDVGAGTIDWKTILRQSKQAGFQHFIVEHDEPKDVYASITASYQYLSTLEF